MLHLHAACMLDLLLAQVPAAKIEIHGTGAAWLMCCLRRRGALIQARAEANWARLVRKQRHLKKLQSWFHNVRQFLQNFRKKFLTRLSKVHKD